MSTLATSSNADELWKQCLELDHESLDQETVTRLFHATSQALKSEAGSGSKQRHEILRVWATEIGLVLP